MVVPAIYYDLWVVLKTVQCWQNWLANKKKNIGQCANIIFEINLKLELYVTVEMKIGLYPTTVARFNQGHFETQRHVPCTSSLILTFNGLAGSTSQCPIVFTATFTYFIIDRYSFHYRKEYTTL